MTGYEVTAWPGRANTKWNVEVQSQVAEGVSQLPRLRLSLLPPRTRSTSAPASAATRGAGGGGGRRDGQTKGVHSLTGATPAQRF